MEEHTENKAAEPLLNEDSMQAVSYTHLFAPCGCDDKILANASYSPAMA